jgi:hypothetical protein
MATQLHFFEPPHQRSRRASRQPQPVEIPLNSTVPEAARPRLNAQHQALLARLAQGPATNRELKHIAERFGARIQELRRAHYVIEQRPVSEERGVYRYELKGKASSAA